MIEYFGQSGYMTDESAAALEASTAAAIEDIKAGTIADRKKQAAAYLVERGILRPINQAADPAQAAAINKKIWPILAAGGAGIAALLILANLKRG